MSQEIIDMKNSCCKNKSTYTITYKVGKKETTTNVCITCFNQENKSENYPDTLIKPFQRNILKIVCNTCGNNVTKTLGCATCKSQQEQSC